MTFQEALASNEEYIIDGITDEASFKCESYYCKLGIALFDLGILNYNMYFLDDMNREYDVELKKAMLATTHGYVL